MSDRHTDDPTDHTDHTDDTDHDEPQPTGSPDMTSLHSDTTPRPDQPLHDPLPYGSGVTDPQQFGYGTSPAYGAAAGYGAAPVHGIPTGYGVAYETDVATDAVARRERSGSPVLAVAGLLSLGVAVWAILGAPVITTTVVIAASLVLLVLVGLAMVIRR
ncbi:hypothetical protein CEY15_07270 [Dietzia natronolimnaea]|uniref:Uncharacterized protein n=1 Tax=Dietzia natronolimnaea TaxID=161920 RepID=A0A2A2WRT0_9ACTN|nr:hypothetical protein [Dietzia natronolimnaea]PAY23684.1 hypothetical protein CEY15_07270 [Dietzia natronolimnaea]